MKRLALAVLLTLALAGCGGAGSKSTTAPKSAQPPKPVDVTVNLHDAVPLEILFNGTGGRCITANIAQEMRDAMNSGGDITPTKVTLTLKDADGAVVGYKKLPGVGGRLPDSADGCTWPVKFPGLKASKFYTATVATAKVSHDATGPVSGTSAVVDLEF